MRYTLRDPSLPHQVVFSHTGNKMYVSCNCRAVPPARNELGQIQAVTVHNPMGESGNLDEARELYNKPGNHTRPFTDEDKAKW